jgi:hypothetical protein
MGAAVRVTNWEQLPLVMTVDDVVALTGLAKGTIWNRCQAKKRTVGGPINFTDKPYTWYREHVKAHYERGGSVPVAQPNCRRKPFENVTDLRLAKEQLQRAVNA